MQKYSKLLQPPNILTTFLYKNKKTINNGITPTTPTTPKTATTDKKSEMIAHLAFMVLLYQLLNNLDNNTTVQVLCAVLA
jgi:hypothetical protein